MGSRPLRMKVRWGCPPRLLSSPPHRTQSWRPCLPGQPWASGWRSTDRPVPSPHGWTIRFSEQGAANNRALPRCLCSRRCMRSWRVRGWPLSRPEAARPPPPSSLPLTAEWPGGTRAFPRWRERSRCTCAHETPPLGGTVRILNYLDDWLILAQSREQLGDHRDLWRFSTAWYGTVRYGSLLGGFPLGTVPGTWYFFSTTSVEVPCKPYRYQNVTCKLCWSLIGLR